MVARVAAHLAAASVAAAGAEVAAAGPMAVAPAADTAAAAAVVVVKARTAADLARGVILQSAQSEIFPPKRRICIKPRNKLTIGAFWVCKSLDVRKPNSVL